MYLRMKLRRRKPKKLNHIQEMKKYLKNSDSGPQVSNLNPAGTFSIQRYSVIKIEKLLFLVWKKITNSLIFYS